MVAPRYRGVAFIALSSVFFGLMAVVTRLVAGQLPAAQIATVRFSVGIVACLVLFALQRRRPQLGQWRMLLVRGTLGGFAAVSYFYAIEHLGAAPATVLNYSSPVYAAVFAGFFLGERTTAYHRLGLLLATTGAVLVTLGSGSSLGEFTLSLGAVVGVLSGVAGGGSMTSIRRLRDDTDALTIFFAFCVVGTVVSVPLAVQSWVPLEGNAFLLAIAVGLISVVAQLLFTHGMGLTTATAGSAATQLTPVVVWLLASTWLHEATTPLGVVGAVCCVGGVLLGMVRPAVPAETPQR